MAMEAGMADMEDTEVAILDMEAMEEVLEDTEAIQVMAMVDSSKKFK